MKNVNNCWEFPQYVMERNLLLQVGGSYYYQGEWENIDHIFYSPSLSDKKGLDLVQFSVIDCEPLVKSNGQPYKFSVSNGNGYSDHLPIGCVLEWQ